jgi:16S rRNA (adenine1518-N6/adenine1519-N6)-dimethyltransferase
VTDGRGVVVTPATARRLLAEHGLAPRKADGQNFVVDPNTVARIVVAADLAAEDTVLEIGPGLGSLTVALARVARRVVAVEIDTGLARVATEMTADLAGVEVIHGDALRLDLDDLLAEPARLVANLPYSVATPLLLTALDTDRVRDAYVMVQREVGRRWVAQPGDPEYGAVSVKVALAATARIDRNVPRSVFWPVPNVDSAMVRVTRRPDAPERPERARIATVVDAAFAQRRKTLRNNLVRRYGEEAVAALSRAGIDPGVRAETLNAAAFAALADELPDGG